MSAQRLSGDVEVAVIGTGLMGSAAAWELARRGHEVLALERFQLGHRDGSSHGSARIVRHAYEDPFYVRLAAKAIDLWRELEDDSGERLLSMVGGVDHGTPERIRDVAAALSAEGVEHELLSPRDAGERWPGLRFEHTALFHPAAGTVDADAAVAAFLDRARHRGVTIQAETEVRRISVPDDGPDARARIETDRGTFTARRVVVAAGPWAPDLLGGLVPLPRMTVTQHNVFHFPRRDPRVEWPVTIHWGAPVYYSTPGGRDGGPDRGRKVTEYRDPDAVPTTGDSRTGVVNPAARKRVRDYVEEWLPGLSGQPFAESTCLYTSTDNEDFVLDRRGPVVVCSPCSGHGAKFAPLIGGVAADLVAGNGPLSPRFALPE
ncbi:FAD-dependent oxidoreductase [Spiractinospora alimapuensis]|uniref:FAD-dependent oxidoreductase n=1 Tax=Spiractinospora alimapuensis TaxID=2820884 RepID=UPI001F3D7E44|nr:FAD-dependent oxidoreductase [Spiractinospora alimapuensis]